MTAKGHALEVGTWHQGLGSFGKFVKLINLRTNQATMTCGLHFHVSGYELTMFEDEQFVRGVADALWTLTETQLGWRTLRVLIRQVREVQLDHCFQGQRPRLVLPGFGLRAHGAP